MIKQERFSLPKEGIKMSSQSLYMEPQRVLSSAKGSFIIEMKDIDTGETLYKLEKDNVITLDAGVLAAILFANRNTTRGLYMLAVGTGATGDLLAPDAPDPRQRGLNAEIARKAFSGVQYRKADGTVSPNPTNVVDFTTSFGSGEAVGPLNEMGLVSPISENPLVTNPIGAVFPTYNPEVDLLEFDILVNYLTFGVITKPATAILTITWRLTF